MILMVGPVVWEMAGVAGLGWRVNNRERERGERQKDTLKLNNSSMQMIVTLKSGVFT